MSVLKKTLLTVTCLAIVIPFGLHAATFNPDYILSDDDLTDHNSMSVSRIQGFLSGRGTLGSYTINDPWGKQKTAAQVIYDAAQYWRISPSYLIVRMQIEQSLITDTTPTEGQYNWATGYGVCDSCSKEDPSVKKFMGFFNQVNWAARRIRETYLPGLEQTGRTISGWGPGITKTTGDGYSVTPVNNATAVLYTYTPYVYNANYNVWKYWNAWFVRDYPDGSVLQVQGERGIYLIQNGKKRPFNSRAAFLSRFDPSRVIVVSKNDIDAYETGPAIKFANYSLVRSLTTKKVYLIDGDTLRYISSPEVFRKIGFNPEEIIDITDTDLAPYQYGEAITIASIYPTGVLLQSKENGGISYVENGIRHSLMSKEILRSRFPKLKPVVVEQASINEFTKGDPVLFKDGELITSPGVRGIYVISNGKRRGIANRETFDALGYSWKNVIKTTDQAVFIHPEGEKINVMLSQL